MNGQQLLELSGLLALQRVRPPAGLLRQLAEATGPELPRMEGPLLVSLAWTFAELRVSAGLMYRLWAVWAGLWAVLCPCAMFPCPALRSHAAPAALGHVLHLI